MIKTLGLTHIGLPRFPKVIQLTIETDQDNQ